MTVQEAVTRGNNLVATAIVAISGFAFAPEIFEEDEHEYKLDDALLLILGIIAIIWYRMKNNSIKRSPVPFVFTLLGLAIKIMATALEFKDAADVGDDFGGLLVFLLGSILVGWLYFRNKQQKNI